MAPRKHNRHCEAGKPKPPIQWRLWQWIAASLTLLAMTNANFSKAHAEMPPLEPPYGLAMHGKPLYEPDDTTYANADAPKGGHLKQAAIGTFDTLNPYAIKGKAAKGLNLVYDRLMRRMWDEPFTMYPMIARAAEVPDDRSSITFYLDERARFHDGSPITAEDVLFSFETLKEQGRPNMRRIYRLVESAGITGEGVIHFKLGEGFDRETVMILALMPVLSKAYWEGREFDSTTLDIPDLNGPYRIKDFDPGRSITYERVKDYWATDLLPNRGHHNFDKIIYEYFRDDTIALEAFKKGDLNFRREWSVKNWESAYDIPAVQNGKIVKYEPRHSRAARAKALIFNMRRAPFNDIRVREALALAFNEKWISKNIYYDRFKRITSYFPGSPLAHEAVPDGRDYRRRLTVASQLLSQANWGVVNGQRIHEETGKPLIFEIITTGAEDEKIALYYKKSLERLGITLNIRNLDSAGFQDRLNNYDYDMVAYYWQNSLSPGTEQMLYWSCEAAEKPSHWNFAGICREDVDALAASIADAKTYEDLTEKTRALDKILIEEHIAIPLFYNDRDFMAYWKPLAHPEDVPLYGPVIETWWMNEGED